MEPKIKLEEYVDACWDDVSTYIYGILDGSIVCNKWIKKAVQNYKKDVNRKDVFEYKVDMVDKVFKFFYFININKDNRYQRFQLLPFQAFIIAALFGFYWKGTNKRRYRYAFLFMGRKNGKSVFSAALQIYFLIADGVEDPQSLLLASTREQASICLDYATGIINHSPALRKRLEAQRYKIIFKDKTKGGFSKVLASNAHKLDGYSASGAILDEVHAYSDDKLFNVIKSSILARENPMIFLITTAGFSLTSFCYNHMLYCQNILNGDIEDDTTFAMMYTLDEKDSPADTSTWCKSNPALGHINHMEDLMSEYNQSKYSITQLNNFLTKHLNVFVDQEAAWIPNEVLAKCTQDFNIEDLYGERIYIGLDLSATRDLTALVGLIKKDDKFYALPYFFMANNAEKFLRSGGVNLKSWIKDGIVELCDTPTIDYDLVVEKFAWLKEHFEIEICRYDPHNSAAIINKLYELEIPCKPFQQRGQYFNEPLKALEKEIFDGNFIMNSPALKWNINNAVPYRDGNANIKLMKNKSLDSIDGAVSLGMAMGGWMDSEANAMLDKSVWQN